MRNAAATVHLKPGRQKPVKQGHPWVFSGAIARWDGARAPGVVVDVHAHDGAWLARGLGHPDAALAVRLYTRAEEEAVDARLFDRLLAEAVARRAAYCRDGIIDAETNAYRLVFSESDGLSGLVVDRYADLLAVRVESGALFTHIEGLLESLVRHTACTALQVSTDRDAIKREALDAGRLARYSTATVAEVEIREHGHRFEVDAVGGQKTGFFLDQRENRGRVARYARQRSVLSGYCYTGAFDVYAARAGARSVTSVDTSAEALEQAQGHMRLNGLALPHECIKGDVPRTLRTFRDAGRTFGLVILDPPRFIASRTQLEKGLRAYKDANLWALKLLEPGGILATFSCSGLVDEATFAECIRWAAVDSGREVQTLERLGQGPDHPSRPAIPESSYLKGLICRAD